MAALFRILLSLIAILNATSGLVGGVWLLIAGEGWLVLKGVGLAIVGAFLVPFAVVLGAAVVRPLAQAWETLLAFAWVTATFLWLGFGQPGPPLVVLLWAYAVAIAPWAVLAGQQRDDTATQVITVGACLGALAVLVLGLITQPGTIAVGIAIALPLALALAAAPQLARR